MITDLSLDHREFLKSRGYLDSFIDEEGWFTLPDGKFDGLGVNVNFGHPMVANYCKSPTGALTALQLLNPLEKEYRRFKTEAGEYLPVYFTGPRDFAQLESSFELVLTEGVFDRIAIKRATTNYATLALLGLGVSDKLIRFLCLRAMRVWLMLDNDIPGTKAQDKISHLLNAKGVDTQQIWFPYKDAAKWMEKKGAAEMGAEINRQMELKRW